MKITPYRPVSRTRLQEILNRFPSVRVGVVGDGCVDIYWEADMTKSVLSRETPHYPLPILQERFSLGGGGNVAANIKSLGVSRLSFVTCVGTDWRERIFRDLMEQQEISYADVLQSAKRVTPAYCKPLRHGISDVVYEDPRLDFSNYESLCRMDEDRFLERLHAAADSSDVLAVSDQLEFGCITPRIRDALCAIARNMPVVVDSRERIGLYRHAIIKPNEVECGQITRAPASSADLKQHLPQIAKQLREHTCQNAVLTLGDRGAAWIQEKTVSLIPAVPVSGPVDFVGAGDSFLAGFCCAIASGATGEEAVEIANLTACVTIQKIGTTGTATASELLNQYDIRQEKKDGMDQDR